MIAKNYDVFLVDLWGVIFDGNYLYDGVLDTLDQLKKMNKKVIYTLDIGSESTSYALFRKKEGFSAPFAY